MPDEKISAEKPEWQQFAEKNYRWNYFWGLFSTPVAWGAIYYMIPLMLRRLIDGSNNPLLIVRKNAIVSAIITSGVLAQFTPPLFAANLIETRERKMPAFYFMAVWSVLFLGLMVLLVYSFGLGHPVFTLAGFFMCYIVFWVFLGSVNVAQGDVFGKAYPLERRSGFFGLRFAIAQVMLFGLGVVIKRFLDPISEENPYRSNYTPVFMVALVMVTAVLICFGLMREPIHGVRKEKKNVWKFLKDSFRLTMVVDKSYRAFSIMRMIQTLSGSGAQFYTLYMNRELLLPESLVGTVTQVVAVVNTVAYFSFGWVGNRMGSKFLLQLSSCIGIVQVIALISIKSTAKAVHSFEPSWDLMEITKYLYIFAYVLTQLNYSCSTVGRMNYPLEIAPPALRPTYVGFAVTILMPFFLIQGFAGVLVDHSSFATLFVVTGMCSLLSLIPSFWMENVGRKRYLEIKR